MWVWKTWKASSVNVKVIFYQLSVFEKQLVKFITMYLRKSGPDFFVQITAGGRKNTTLFI
jgi:hypothetical protein